MNALAWAALLADRLAALLEGCADSGVVEEAAQTLVAFREWAAEEDA